MEETTRNHRIKFRKWACSFSKQKNFFISYPKSGRTWVRFLVNAYKTELYKIEVRNVFEAERKLRLKHHVEWTHLAGHQKNAYYAMRPENLGLLRKTPCVFMMRNFHATLASAWFQVTQRLGVDLKDKDSFLCGTRHGLMHIIAFYNSWIEIERQLGTVEQVSYERLQTNTRDEFILIIKSLGLSVDQTLVNETLEMGSFENMKRLGVSDAYAGTVLAPADRSNPDSAKVRSGSSGSYREVFSENQVDYINETIKRYFVGYGDPRYAECVEEKK